VLAQVSRGIRALTSLYIVIAYLLSAVFKTKNHQTSGFLFDIIIEIMNNGDFFFLVFLATIVLSKILCLVKTRHSPTIKGFRTHHYMTGLLIVLISLFISNITLFAIGLGLFIDEAPLFIKWRKWTWKDNYSLESFLILLFLVLFVYIFRNNLLLISI
jgi:hypothetical protein